MLKPSKTKTASLGKEIQHLPVEPTPAETKEPRNPNEPAFPDGGHLEDVKEKMSASCTANAPFIERQARMNDEYKRDYKKWTSGMAPKKLQKLKDLGLDKPKISYRANGAPKADLADSPMASYEPDIAALIDGDDEQDSDEPTAPDVLEVLRHLMAILIFYKNIRLTVECLTLVLGLSAYDGSSMTAIARRHKITTSAVSKRCVELTETLSIRPSRAMQSILARENHRKARNKSKREQQP